MKFRRDAVKPVAEQYLKVVGRQTDLPLNLEIDQFFSWLYKAYSEKAGAGKDDAASTRVLDRLGLVMGLPSGRIFTIISALRLDAMS